MTAGLPLLLVEPAPSAAWFPWAGARPIADLRAGALRLRERWALVFDRPVAAILSDAVPAPFDDLEALPLRPGTPVVGPALVARSDVAPALQSFSWPAETRRLVLDGETVAWRLAAGEPWTRDDEAGPASRIAGLRLHGAWDLVTALERLLADDVRHLAGHPGLTVPPPAPLVLGDPAHLTCRSALVEPGVVFDLRNGPILLEADVEVRHGTRLEGPLHVAAGTRLLGGDVRGSSIGPRCVVRGEVSTTCFTGYANKGHEGFVGHSVVGHWANLGAGTTTSNLKNTYGPVRLGSPDGRLETGRQFLGTLFGDHVKTAIGTLCSTGTLLGTGANIFGGAPPRCVPAFAWGGRDATRLERAAFLATAERVLPRRQVDWTPARAETLAALHDRLAHR